MDWSSLSNPHADTFWIALLVVAAVGGVIVGIAANTGLWASTVAIAVVAALLAARVVLSVCTFLDERYGDTLRETTPWLAIGFAGALGGGAFAVVTGGNASQGGIIGLSVVLYAYLSWLFYRLWPFAVGTERTT